LIGIELLEIVVEGPHEENLEVLHARVPLAKHHLVAKGDLVFLVEQLQHVLKHLAF
jgi:hypothetical protein